MRLTGKDYNLLIAQRAEEVRGLVNWGNAPAAIGGNVEGPAVPQFDKIKRSINDLVELVEEYENSLSPL